MDAYHSNLVLEDALADDQRTVEVRLGERGLANEMAERLAEQGAHDVTVVRERGIVAFGSRIPHRRNRPGCSNACADRFWIRDKTQCRTVYDVRHKTIQTRIDCQIKDGKIIVIAPGGKITIHDPSKLVGFDNVLHTAIKSGAEAAVNGITGGIGTFDKE